MGAQTGFCEGGRKKNCPLMRVSMKRTSTVYCLHSIKSLALSIIT